MKSEIRNPKLKRNNCAAFPFFGIGGSKFGFPSSFNSDFEFFSLSTLNNKLATKL